MRVANWESEIAIDHFCACGCGEKITVRPFHRRVGIPKFIKGHSSRVNNPMSGKHPSEETRRKLSAARKGRPFTEEHKRKISEAQKGRHHTPANDFKKGNTICKGRRHSEETKRKMSIAAKDRPKGREAVAKSAEARRGFRHSMDTRMKLSQAHRGKKFSDGQRKKMSLAAKELFKCKSHCEKMGKAWGIKPNKPESVVMELLNNLYPGEWKYTGDFSFTINGKCPDFVNVNGQKKIIEVFGDYWHRGENPDDRAAIFKPYGYETLVIWECELGDLLTVEEKIKVFRGKNRIMERR